MPAASARGARRIRTWSLLGLVLLIAGLMLASCPDLRDGTPGQLAGAERDTESAARSGALALQLWDERRATAALTAVALCDARDDVLKATGRRQEPFVYGSLPSEAFYLHRP